MNKRFNSLDNAQIDLDPNLATNKPNWQLRAILGVGMIGTLLAGLVALANKDPIECQSGKFDRVCTSSPRSIKLQSPQKIGDILYYPYLSVRDSRGKSTEINMAVLSDRYEWQLGSSNRIKFNGKNQSLQISVLKQKLEKQEIFKIMGNPNRIVTIGAASCSGSSSQEELLALNRAKIIQVKIVKPLFSVREYLILNLGQFKRDTCEMNYRGNSLQRGLVIIGMRKESVDLNTKEALYQRLSKTIKNLNLDDYSLGNIEKFELLNDL